MTYLEIADAFQKRLDEAKAHNEKTVEITLTDMRWIIDEIKYLHKVKGIEKEKYDLEATVKVLTEASINYKEKYLQSLEQRLTLAMRIEELMK